MNRIKLFLFALLTVSLLASCNDEGSEVKDAAKDAIENPNAANVAGEQPNNFESPTPAEAAVPT